jgi:hypothetical protein
MPFVVYGVNLYAVGTNAHPSENGKENVVHPVLPHFAPRTEKREKRRFRGEARWERRLEYWNTVILGGARHHDPIVPPFQASTIPLFHRPPAGSVPWWAVLLSLFNAPGSYPAAAADPLKIKIRADPDHR